MEPNPRDLQSDGRRSVTDCRCCGRNILKNGYKLKINKYMNEKAEEKEKVQPETPSPKPNELGGFYFSSGVKITDPNTKEILVQIRGDN